MFIFYGTIYNYRFRSRTKGVTFANLVDPECKWIDSVIDLNLQKQGMYIPSTEHPDENTSLLNTINLKVDLIK